MSFIEGRNRAKAARIFHALSDETRLDILARLASGEQCVCELVDSLQAAQSRLSFHLKVLKDAGLIQDRPEGRWIYYALDENGLKLLEQFVGSLASVPTAQVGASRC
jgi:ArsR family transcriptional regulator, arsenate/arsenite/antimonite-responsive transcriptional repressor